MLVKASTTEHCWKNHTKLYYSNISINSTLTQIVLQYELSQLSLPEDTIG